VIETVQVDDIVAMRQKALEKRAKRLAANLQSNEELKLNREQLLNNVASVLIRHI
jgi:hypothetical protein